MAEKDETTCLIDVTQRGSVKTSVQVPVKGITDTSPVHKPVIKSGKGKISCLLDGGKRFVHGKESDNSWGVESLKGSQRHKLSS